MRVSVSTPVAGPAERLFWLSQDYARRLEWDTYLVAAYLLGPHATAAVGVDAYCRNRRGQVLVSRYVSFRPPTHTAVRMIEGPWLLQSLAGTWRFRPRADGRTEVSFIYNLRVRPAGLRWLLEPLVAMLYRRDMRRRLHAFRRWAEALPDAPLAGPMPHDPVEASRAAHRLALAVDQAITAAVPALVDLRVAATPDGVVSLSARVADEPERQRVVAIASAVPGVRRVVENLAPV